MTNPFTGTWEDDDLVRDPISGRMVLRSQVGQMQNPFLGTWEEDEEDDDLVRDPLSGRMVPKSQIRERLAQVPKDQSSDPRESGGELDFWEKAALLSPTGSGALVSQLGPRVEEGVAAIGRLPEFVSEMEAARQSRAGPAYHATGEQLRYSPEEIEQNRQGRKEVLEAVAPDVLQDWSAAAHERYLAAKERLSEAGTRAGLPPAVIASLDTAAEGASYVADPLNFIPVHQALRMARKLRPGAAAAESAAMREVSDAVRELAEASQRIGRSEAATRRVSQVVDSTPEGAGAVRQLRALDQSGEEIGSMTFSVEPEGGFRVMDVATEGRGTGGMREMYRKASEMSGGPRLGGAAQTAEGEAALARLRETDPDLFAPEKISRGRASGEPEKGIDPFDELEQEWLAEQEGLAEAAEFKPIEYSPEEALARARSAPSWMRHSSMEDVLDKWSRGQISDSEAAYRGLVETGVLERAEGTADSFIREGGEVRLRSELLPENRPPGAHRQAVEMAFSGALDDLSRFSRKDSLTDFDKSWKAYNRWLQWHREMTENVPPPRRGRASGEPDVVRRRDEEGFIQIGRDQKPSDPVRDGFLEKYGGQATDPVPTDGKSFLKRLSDRIHIETWNVDKPAEDLLKAAGRSADEAAQVVARARGAREIATGPLYRGTARWDSRTGELVYTGEPLKNIIHGMDGESLKDLDSLMMAERQMELSERLSAAQAQNAEIGLKSVDAGATAEAGAQIAHLRQKLGVEGFEELRAKARRIRDWSEKAIVKPLLEIGLISGDDAKKILAANQRYAPFDRIQRIAEEAASGSGGKYMEEITSGLSEEAKIAFPLEEFVVKTQKVHRWIERQRVRNELGDAIEQTREEWARKRARNEPTDGIDEFEWGRRAEPKEVASGKAFPVFRDGKKVHYVPRDPELMKLLESSTPSDASLLMKAISFPARMLRAAATSALGFVQRNFFRDQWFAAWMSDWGYRPFYDGIKGAMYHTPMGKRLTKYYDEYHDSGAAIASMASVDRPHAAATVRDLSGKGAIAKMKKFARDWRKEGVLYPVQGLVSAPIERYTRMGAFARARQQGATHAEAMLEARQVSIDFSRGGRTGRQLNMVEAFANPELQEIERVASKFRRNPKAAVAKTLKYMTLPAVANWALNRNNQDYENLPEWDKAAFFHVHQMDPERGGWFIRIPRPVGALALMAGYGVEKFLDYASDRDPEAVKEFVDRVKTDTPARYLPSAEYPLSPELLPTALEPVAELAAGPGGWDFWRDRPIVSRSLQGVDPEEQYNDYTPRLLRDIGAATGASPLKLQHGIEAYTSGVGRTAVEILDYYYKQSTGEREGDVPELPGTPKTNPLTRAFVSQSPYGFGTEPVEKLFDLVDRADQSQRTLNRKLLNMGPVQIAKYKAEHPELRLIKELRESKQHLLELQKRRNRIRRLPHITPQKRAEELLKLDQMVTQWAQHQMEMYRHRLEAMEGAEP